MCCIPCKACAKNCLLCLPLKSGCLLLSCCISNQCSHLSLYDNYNFVVHYLPIYTIFYLVNCRLDSRASILDLRVECQDLERFSVINRFAKFHSRGQHDGAETSSSSDTTFQRFFPVKLVTEVPLPRNLPDRVQCLSL